MRFITKALTLIGLMVALALPGFGQATLDQTTLSAAMTETTSTMTVASATGFVVNHITYVDKEAMRVQAISGTTITVRRGRAGTPARGHINGAAVSVGLPNRFLNQDPKGSCVLAGTTAQPQISIPTGRQWICDATLLTYLPLFTSGAITPVATPAAIGVDLQTFTINGLVSGAPLAVYTVPAPTALCPLVSVRVSAANTVQLGWATLTAAACTPAAGTYLFYKPIW